jgi:hypothetical protein
MVMKLEFKRILKEYAEEFEIVLKIRARFGHDGDDDERFATCFGEFDKDFRSILLTFPIPRKLLHQLLFIEI